MVNIVTTLQTSCIILTVFVPWCFDFYYY